jgi:transcriptional regulator with XRE-family HTH domain
MATIGQRIQSLRVSKGLSQPQLAHASGVPVGTIRGIEAGRRPNPRWGTLRRLLLALDAPLEESVASSKEE